MLKKISIIIPVYNGRQYIARCIDSILNQTGFDVDDLEILPLDDGSKDDSLKILTRYMEKYPRIIKASSHTNRGVAETRNRGIELATGKYVMFIDQDDFIDPDYCATLYDEAEAGGYDVVLSGKKRPDEKGNIVGKDIFKDAYFSRLMCVSIWAKIHRTEFLRTQKIRVINNRQGEDVLFSFEEAQKTDNMKCLEYCGYNWFYNTQSVSNTTQRGLHETNLQLIREVQDKLIELDRRKDNENMFFITMMTAYYIFFSGRASSKAQFMKAVRVLMGNLQTAYPSYGRNPYLWKAPMGTLPVFSFGIKAFMILYKLKLLGLFATLYCRGTEK